MFRLLWGVISNVISLQSMVKDMDSYSERCIGKEDFFKLATVSYPLLFSFTCFKKLPFNNNNGPMFYFQFVKS